MNMHNVHVRNNTSCPDDHTEWKKKVKSICQRIGEVPEVVHTDVGLMKPHTIRHPVIHVEAV